MTGVDEMIMEKEQIPLKIQWIWAMLHGVGSQKTAIFRVSFLFSLTPVPAQFPTKLSVHCVQLFFDGKQSGQGLNLTNSLSPLSSPKFIFNLSEYDFSIVRSTRSFRWKLRKKVPVWRSDYSSFCGRYRTCRYLLFIDWLKYPETLIPISGFCKCGHKNTGFDKLQKFQLFKKIHAPRGYLFIVTSRLSRS
jgi:hypothetical protein